MTLPVNKPLTFFLIYIIMLKQKYLHRSQRKSNDSDWLYHNNKIKNIDLFSDLPFHEPIRKLHGYSRYLKWDCRPLEEFINSKVGCKWDDVYSEILKKIKKKYRYYIDEDIDYHVELNAYYDENFFPVSMGRGWRRRGSVLINKLFIDENGILVCKSEDEIVSDSIRIKRKLKMQLIIDNIKNDEDDKE